MTYCNSMFIKSVFSNHLSLELKNVYEKFVENYNYIAAKKQKPQNVSYLKKKLQATK